MDGTAWMTFNGTGTSHWIFCRREGDFVFLVIGVSFWYWPTSYFSLIFLAICLTTLHVNMQLWKNWFHPCLSLVLKTSHFDLDRPSYFISPLSYSHHCQRMDNLGRVDCSPCIAAVSFSSSLDLDLPGYLSDVIARERATWEELVASLPLPPPDELPHVGSKVVLGGAVGAQGSHTGKQVPLLQIWILTRLT